MKTLKTITLAASLLLAWQGVWAQVVPEIEGLTYNSIYRYYEIPDAAALNALATYVNDGNDCEGLTFKVTGEEIKFDNQEMTFDLDDNGSNDSNYKPIGHRFVNEAGAANSFFCGEFDGDNKTISGIVVNDPDGFNVGLFGTIGEAIIKNVKLEDCTFTSNFCVGGIVGLSLKNGSISECSVGSGVTVNAVSCTIYSEEIPGVIVGGIIGDCTETTISNCLCAATVIGDEYVGGIAGRLLSVKNINDGTEDGIIDECYFTGKVESEGTSNGTIVGARGPIDEIDGEGSTGSKGILSFVLLDNDNDEDIKNEERIKMYDSQVCNVTLSGRTFYKDDSWNTLCLPFNLTEEQIAEEDCPLKDATIMSFDYETSKFDKGTLTMNFSGATKISNKMPYIVKWSQSTDKENPVFNGVKVEYNETAISHEDADVVFMDVYHTPKVIEREDNTILYLGADNTLYYPSAEMTINAFRGYFQLQNDLIAGEPTEPGQQPIKAFNLNFGDEETGIREISTPSNSSNSSNLWFTLDGRRLNGQPTQSGIFIHGGKKVFLP